MSKELCHAHSPSLIKDHEDKTLPRTDESAPMPDPHLTRKEIRDLAGYIFSFRTAP
jgi:hypothetical protein